MAHSSSAQGSSSSIPPKKYEVFLSFRGEDTRLTFTDHLYTGLLREKISTFKDDEKLKKGEEISTELSRAIEDSRMAVIVFSKNYASSRWCLDELVKIMECKRKFEQMVLPVFYHVEPASVRTQKRSYAKAFTRHALCLDGSGMEGKMIKWKATLKEAASLSGLNIKDAANGREAVFTAMVIKSIKERLKSTHSNIPGNPYGIVQNTKMLSSPPAWENSQVCLSGGEDRIVLFFTSVRGILKIYDDCHNIRIILKSYRVAIDERDISMDSGYRKQLQSALGGKNMSLPRVFVRGKYVGGIDEIEQLHETSELRNILEGFPIRVYGFPCNGCGDATFVSCRRCSRKMERCGNCNEKGLIRCPICFY